jgi:hypothetical protein
MFVYLLKQNKILITLAQLNAVNIKELDHEEEILKNTKILLSKNQKNIFTNIVLMLHSKCFSIKFD